MNSTDDNAPRAPQPRTGAVTVAGFGLITVPPDRASLSVTVAGGHEDAEMAMAELNRRATAIVTAWRALGVAEADISAGHPWVQDLEGRGSSAPRVHVSTTVTATFANMATAEEALAAAQAAGAIQLQSPSPYLADPEAMRRRACELAFHVAQQRAAEWARLSQAALGQVLAVSEVFETPAAGGRHMAALSGPPTPQRPGDIAVEAAVQVTFELVFPPRA